MGTPVKGTILVVDDYADSREMQALFLEGAGYQVLLAELGRDALVLARAHHPTAIVMDICMPDMDGIATTRCLRAEPGLADIPVVAYSARSSGIEGFEDLFDAVCEPCPPQGLLARIGDAIRARARLGAAHARARQGRDLGPDGPLTD
jgi:CheY-like chemotaxis protein